MTQPVFKDPFVSTPSAITGTGNGTLTVDRLTHFTITQMYTVICTAIAPFTIFRVVGSLDGPVGIAQVGVQFYDDDLKIFFTINQGPTLFAIGDSFTVGVTQGTDLNHANIDIYDALSQKNFSPGLPEDDGNLAGDDNIRFHPTALLGYISYQSLTLYSKLTDEDGDDISIEYLAGTILTAANLVLQDLTFTADTTGLAGNGISVEYEDYDPAVKATVTIQGLLFEADTPGTGGNAITIEYTTGAPTSTPVISVIGTAITVQIQSGITTHAQIKAAVNADPFSSPLVDAITNVVGTATAPDGPNSLTGGLDAVGDAGFEVVTVSTLAIKVKLQSGVSTATQVKAAVDAFGPSAALVNTTISGTGSNPQTAPVAPTSLTGGLDDIGSPGNEIVTVTGRAIAVTFQNGINTATDIKNAIEGYGPSNALVTVTINTGQATSPQNSAFAKEYLGGAAGVNTYALNSDELSNAPDFYEGIASLILRNLFVQGRMYVRENAKFRRVVTLDDLDAAINLSGPAIPNLQKAFNDNIEIERDDRNMKLVKGGTWSAAIGGVLSFTADAFIQIPSLQDARNKIPFLTQSPITLSTDGDVAYVEVNRGTGVDASLTVQVSPIQSLIPTDNTFVIARRLGTDILVGEDTLLEIGQESKLGATGSSTTTTTGGNGVDSDGNVTTKLKPAITTFILQSPDLTKWQITASDDGEIVTTSGVSGNVSNVKVTKPDTSEASFDITNAGELQIVSPPAGGKTLNDSLYIESPDLTAWHVTVDDDNQVVLESDTTEANYAQWTNDQNVPIARIQEVAGKALLYLPVFNSVDLPTTPPTVGSLLPLAFYDTGTAKRLVYYDGATWNLL